MHRAKALTAKILAQNAVSLSELQPLAGLLSFAAKVVRLGWVFMRLLWNFEMTFPPGKSRETKRRIPTSIRNDLNWWNTLLPKFNGVLFFDDSSRQVNQLYTDACTKGLGGFFYADASTFWTKAEIRQENAFIAPITEAHHINIHELEAVLLAFRLWAPRWTRTRLIIYTDNTVAFSGLAKQSLGGQANSPLREILLIASKYDILIEPRWIDSETNALADALSRNNLRNIADLCPLWQVPSASMHQAQPSWKALTMD